MGQRPRVGSVLVFHSSTDKMKNLAWYCISFVGDENLRACLKSVLYVSEGLHAWLLLFDIVTGYQESIYLADFALLLSTDFSASKRNYKMLSFKTNKTPSSVYIETNWEMLFFILKIFAAEESKLHPMGFKS